jgi:hypothetical protein
MTRSATLLVVVLSIPFISAPASAETVTIEATRDATMIQDPDGALANGSGEAFFVGRTGQNQNAVRRGLLQFDLAGAIPEGSVIEAASLTLYLTPSHPEPREIRLHRVLADWSEGASSSSGGGGAPSEPGDVTWIHTSYDTGFWVIAGGQFVAHPSASRDVSGEGFHSWSDRQLARDIRMWLAAPSRNFGWILIGDESTLRSSKRFASREEPDATLRPVLEVTFRSPGPP